MIVCLCHRVSDRDIVRAVVHGGATSFAQLQRDTGVATGCGCCRDCAKQVFESARGSASPVPLPGLPAVALPA